MSAGADGNSRNDGDFVSPSLAVTMNGSLPLRSPGSDHIGNQKEARFVGEDDMGTQPCSVFFMRGHSSCFQRSISSSLPPVHAVPAFVESIPGCASSGRYGPDDSALQTHVRPSPQCAA